MEKYLDNLLDTRTCPIRIPGPAIKLIGFSDPMSEEVEAKITEYLSKYNTPGVEFKVDVELVWKDGVFIRDIVIDVVEVKKRSAVYHLEKKQKFSL